MHNLVTIFFTGLFISFLGTLPLGTLNVAAMQIGLTENTRKAIQFSLGVALVEILYVSLSLQGFDWIIANHTIFYVLEWCTVLVFTILAVSSLLAARNANPAAKNILLKNELHRFWLGFTMSALNPVQVPFWFIWSTYLISNKILLQTKAHFTVYTIGIGVGTLGGLAIFIFAGRWLLAESKGQLPCRERYCGYSLYHFCRYTIIPCVA